MSTQKIDMKTAVVGQKVKLRRGDVASIVVNPFSTLFHSAAAIVKTSVGGYIYGVSREGLRTMESKLAAGELAQEESFDWDVVEVLPMKGPIRQGGLVEKLATAIKEGERNGETAMETAERQVIIISRHMTELTEDAFSTVEDHA